MTVSERVERTSHATGMSVKGEIKHSNSSSESDSGPTNTLAGAYGGEISNSISHGYSVKSGSGTFK